MATRSTSRKVSVTTMSSSSSMETPKQGVSSSTPRSRASPLSPTRLSRLQEKAELQGLNDRLAAYIDRVRQLESENRNLNVQVETIQESMTKEVRSMKGLYEKELSDARSLLDETSKEKAQLQIDVGKLHTENEDLRRKLAKKERDLAAAEKSLAAAEAEVKELASRLGISEADRKKLIAELTELKDDVSRLTRQLAEAKKQLEVELLARVENENRCLSLKEELQFKSNMFEQEITEVKKRKQVELSELDGELQQQYQTKLLDALQDLRDQYEEQIKNSRLETDYLYEAKMDELNKRQQRAGDEAAQLGSALKEARTKVTELTSRLSYLESENGSLKQRVADLEAQVEAERVAHSTEVASLREEIQRLQQEMADQLEEYQDLMDIKLALDMEIGAYRKLLEAEETRLNISVRSQDDVDTPARRTPLRGVKRKRQVIEEVEESRLQSTARSSGDIELLEDCNEGKFVKLLNKSDKDFSIGGYQIIRNAGESETVFKFHSRAKIPAGETATVWSCDQEVTHEPPLNIVMKNQKWAVADEMSTKLISSSEVSEEMAVRETRRMQESKASLSMSYPDTKAEQEDPEVERLYTGCVIA